MGNEYKIEVSNDGKVWAEVTEGMGWEGYRYRRKVLTTGRPPVESLVENATVNHHGDCGCWFCARKSAPLVNVVGVDYGNAADYYDDSDDEDDCDCCDDDDEDDFEVDANYAAPVAIGNHMDRLLTPSFEKLADRMKAEQDALHFEILQMRERYHARNAQKLMEDEAYIAQRMQAVNASYQESELQRRQKEQIMQNMVRPMTSAVMGWDKRGRR